MSSDRSSTSSRLSTLCCFRRSLKDCEQKDIAWSKCSLRSRSLMYRLMKIDKYESIHSISNPFIKNSLICLWGSLQVCNQLQQHFVIDVQSKYLHQNVNAFRQMRGEASRTVDFGRRIPPNALQSERLSHIVPGKQTFDRITLKRLLFLRSENSPWTEVLSAVVYVPMRSC